MDRRRPLGPLRETLREKAAQFGKPGKNRSKWGFAVGLTKNVGGIRTTDGQQVFDVNEDAIEDGDYPNGTTRTPNPSLPIRAIPGLRFGGIEMDRSRYFPKESCLSMADAIRTTRQAVRDPGLRGCRGVSMNGAGANGAVADFPVPCRGLPDHPSTSGAGAPLPRGMFASFPNASVRSRSRVITGRSPSDTERSYIASVPR